MFQLAWLACLRYTTSCFLKIVSKFSKEKVETRFLRQSKLNVAQIILHLQQRAVLALVGFDKNDSLMRYLIPHWPARFLTMTYWSWDETELSCCFICFTVLSFYCLLFTDVLRC